jgi:hypothetical protein
VYGKEGYCELVGDHSIASWRSDSTGTEKMPFFPITWITRELNSLWREWDGFFRISSDSVFIDRKNSLGKLFTMLNSNLPFRGFTKREGKFLRSSKCLKMLRYSFKYLCTSKPSQCPNR